MSKITLKDLQDIVMELTDIMIELNGCITEEYNEETDFIHERLRELMNQFITNKTHQLIKGDD